MTRLSDEYPGLKTLLDNIDTSTAGSWRKPPGFDRDPVTNELLPYLEEVPKVVGSMAIEHSATIIQFPPR